jgi:16S rRNA processing protein RimM
MSAASAPPPSLIIVGAIAGAFGVRGEVRVRSFTANPCDIAAYGPLYDKHGGLILTPTNARPIKDAVAISAPEVKSREAAEDLRGTALYVPRDKLPPAEDDEFYHVDLIACRVETLSGDELGAVRAVHDFGAGDILEITTPDGGQMFIAFTKERVPFVDVGARRLVVQTEETDDD